MSLRVSVRAGTVLRPRSTQPIRDEREPATRRVRRLRIYLHAQLRDGQGVVGLVEVKGEQLVQLADEAGHDLWVGRGSVVVDSRVMVVELVRHVLGEPA